MVCQTPQPCFGMKETYGTMTEIRYIFLIKKGILSFTLLMAISIFFISLISTQISALELTINFPQYVVLNESFDVSISENTGEIHDVKITVLDNENKTISSTLIDKNWKSSFYYLKSSWPSIKIYSLRVNEESAISNLCARMRKPEKTSFTEKCNSIIINQKKSGDVTEKNKEYIEKEVPPIQEIDRFDNSELINTTNIDENKPYSSYINSDVQLTDYARTRLIIVLLFTLITLILVLLVALNKI